MAFNFTKKGAAYDLGLLALCATFIAIIIGRDAFSPTAYMTVLIIVVAAMGVLNTLREAYKESQLDEMQLAAASFGARWAVTIPLTLMLLVLFIPPLQNAVLSFTEALYASSQSPLPPLIRVFIMGAVLAVILQLSGKLLISAIWTRTKG